MEFIIVAVVIIITGLAGFELFEGIFASGVFNGDDEEIFSPIAVFSLLIFLAGLSYFG